MVSVILMWYSLQLRQKQTHPNGRQKNSYIILPGEGTTAPVDAIKAWKGGGVTPFTYQHLQKMKVSGPFLYPMKYSV
jgi:hypothetical protein